MENNLTLHLREFIEETKEFYAQLSRVAGENGLMVKLNQTHLQALSALFEKPADQAQRKRVLDLCKREKTVLEVCEKALLKYDAHAEEIITRVSPYFKITLISVLEELRNLNGYLCTLISQIKQRILIEETLTNLDHSRISQIIAVLQEEQASMKKIITGNTTKKLSKMRVWLITIIRSKQASYESILNQIDQHPDAKILNEFMLFTSSLINAVDMTLKLLSGFAIRLGHLKKELINIQIAAKNQA